MSESEKKQSEKIGVFWKQKSKNGMEYLSGLVNGERVVAFEATEKRTKYSPDYKVYKASPPPTNKNKGEEKLKNEGKKNGEDIDEDDAF